MSIERFKEITRRIEEANLNLPDNDDKVGVFLHKTKYDRDMEEGNFLLDILVGLDLIKIDIKNEKQN